MNAWGRFMKIKNTLTLLTMCFTAAGCTAVGVMDRSARVNPATATARPAAEGANKCPLTRTLAGDQPFAIDLGCFKFQPNDTNEPLAYKMAVDGPSSGSADEREKARRLARNRLEAVLIDHANTICENEKGKIYARRAASAGILDFLASGFSATSTIVGGEQAKSIFAGLAGLSTATRTNIDANVYQNQIVSAITKVMDAERRSILSTMESKHTASTDEYNADEMIRLANSYHQACSFQKGVELLLDAAVNKEGMDYIIKEINLENERKKLVNAINVQRLLDKNDDQGKIAEMIKAHGDLVLQQKSNAEAAEAVTTPN